MISFQGLPSLGLQDGLLRAWWMDPLLATFSFAFFVNVYGIFERRERKSRYTSFSLQPGPTMMTALFYWFGIILWKMVIPPAATKIPDGFPRNGPHFLHDCLYLVAEVASGIILYDAIFFFLHWAMHEIPLLRRIHHRHHQYSVVDDDDHHDQQRASQRPAIVESLDTLRHSLLDGSLQVLVNIMVQRHTPWGYPKTRLARALHNVLVIWMLVESHTTTTYGYVWRQWLVGVREHVHHHHYQPQLAARGLTRYQQFFGYLDHLRSEVLNCRARRKAVSS